MKNIEQLISEMDDLFAKWNNKTISDKQFWDDFVNLGRNAQMKEMEENNEEPIIENVEMLNHYSEIRRSVEKSMGNLSGLGKQEESIPFFQIKYFKNAQPVTEDFMCAEEAKRRFIVLKQEECKDDPEKLEIIKSWLEE